MHPPEDMVHKKKHTLEDFGKDRKDEKKSSQFKTATFGID